VERLDAQIKEKTAALAEKPAQSASSEAVANKLAYFEGEVRKLESQLTQ